MSKVLLRDAQPGDEQIVFELAKALAVFEELEHLFVADVADYAKGIFGENAPAHVILAEVDGVVAGMALYFTTFSTFLGRSGIWLEDLYVHEDFRRCGVATALMGELQRRSEGRLEWEVLDWNDGAIYLYQNMGAEPFSGWIKYRVNPIV